MLKVQIWLLISKEREKLTLESQTLKPKGLQDNLKVLDSVTV